MLYHAISCYVANHICNACVMSLLLLIVGWIIGQGHYGLPTDLAAWGKLHLVVTLDNLAREAY